MPDKPHQSVAITPRISRRWILWYTAIASLTGSMVGSGVFFLASDMYGFSDVTNLLFALVLYIPYIPAAALAGRVTASNRLGAAATLRLVTAAMGLCALWLMVFHDRYSLWCVTPLYNMLAGVQWPIVEAYVTAGSQGPDMRKAIGRFNLTWALTVCPSLWIVGALIEQPVMLFGLLAVAQAGCAAMTYLWPANPPAHDAETQKMHTGPEYGRLLISARILLPVSYVVMYAFTPLLPGIWTSLGKSHHVGAILSSIWMVARVGSFGIMYLWRGWHGRWGVLLLGTVLYVSGFAALLVTHTAWLACAGLILFGTGQGMVYYGALYYAMAVGHARVDSGGMHEMVIGIGYVGGPALGLLGTTWVSPQYGVILIVGCVAVVGGVVACGPYLRARAARRAVGPANSMPAE